MRVAPVTEAPIETITITCADRTQLSLSLQAWRDAFPLCPTSVPFERDEASLLVDLINAIDASTKMLPTFSIAEQSMLAHSLTDNPHIKPVEFFRAFCALQPAIRHPLTHLVAWNAARALRQAERPGSLTESLDTLANASLHCRALSQLYFYFQLPHGEIIENEQILLNHLAGQAAHDFFSSNPQWDLLPKISDLGRRASTIDVLPERVQHETMCQLMSEDEPPLLQYIQELLHRHGKTQLIAPSDTHRLYVYRKLFETLRTNSTTNNLCLINYYQLNPNHLFLRRDIEDTSDTTPMTTPLLLAILRASPPLVAGLLRCGADPTLTIDRATDSRAPITFAQSLIEPERSSVRKHGEIWHRGPAEETIIAMRQILSLLGAHAEPTPPRISVTEGEALCSAQRELSQSTTNTSASSSYLAVPTDQLSPRLPPRRNAIIVNHQSVHPEATPADVPVVETFGCGCRSSGGSKKSKVCTIQ